MLVMIPDVLDRQALSHVNGLIAQGKFVDGSATAGPTAQRVKRNEQLDVHDAVTKELKGFLLERLKRSALLQFTAFPRVIRNPLISRYRPGMEYGLHVDDALMGADNLERSDLSLTLFLNDPGAYDGGELEILSAMGTQHIKLPAGAAVLYPSGALHRVTPLTRGERLAAVTWIHSFVRDAYKREILHDLYRVRDKLVGMAPDAFETNLLHKTQANLLRLWSES